MIFRKKDILSKGFYHHGVYQVTETKSIEFLHLQQRKKQSSPQLFIFLHGHNSSAIRSLDFGLIALELKLDALLISMPGYGLSSGPADYCGPRSAERVLHFLDRFLRQYPYKQKFLCGFSRGALLAALLANRKPDLFDKIILLSGVHDLKASYRRHKKMYYGSIRRNILEETGATPHAFSERYVPALLDNYASPVLILHGSKDQMVPVAQAQMLYKHRKTKGLPVSLTIIKGQEHRLPLSKIKQFLQKFLAK